MSAARKVAQLRSDPDFVDPDDVWEHWQNGQLVQFSRSKRVGDYFDSIQISDNPAEASFDIAFSVREGADRYWKDVAARLLTAIEKAGANASRVIFQL